MVRVWGRPTEFEERTKTMTVTTYQVQGMTCGHCVSSVKAAVGAVPGVTGVEVDLPAESVMTTGTATTQAVSQAVADAGYALVSADQAVGRSLPMASGTGGCRCS
ncbi:heavy-metal-associated domain-containing protein [Dietzia natronolimnaea]